MPQQQRILQIVIRNCHECPFLRYYGESGCRSYTPAHYSCVNPSAMLPTKERQPKFIAEQGSDGWDGTVPEFCPIYKVEQPFTVAGYKEWER